MNAMIGRDGEQSATLLWIFVSTPWGIGLMRGREICLPSHRVGAMLAATRLQRKRRGKVRSQRFIDASQPCPALQRKQSACLPGMKWPGQGAFNGSKKRPPLGQMV